MCKGFQENEREVLKIKAFYTQLSLSCVKNATTLPDFLTLHYLPRINSSSLEINGSNVRPDSPAFVKLHRVLSQDSLGFTYGSGERVVVCEGARFEICVGYTKVLRGIFRKDDIDDWKMDCNCVLSANDVVKGVKCAEVSVVAEGGPEVMSEKVEMVGARRRRRRREKFCELEDIPEEREGEFGSGVWWCSDCGGKEEETDGRDCEMEVDMEGVRWAVDVGIWVVCVGVGFLVSRASTSRGLRRKKWI